MWQCLSVAVRCTTVIVKPDMPKKNSDDKIPSEKEQILKAGELFMTSRVLRIPTIPTSKGRTHLYEGSKKTKERERQRERSHHASGSFRSFAFEKLSHQEVWMPNHSSPRRRHIPISTDEWVHLSTLLSHPLPNSWNTNVPTHFLSGARYVSTEYPQLWQTPIHTYRL